MGNVFIHVTMSLDGLIARQNIESIELERTEVVATSQITSLRFRVVVENTIVASS